MNSDMDFNCKIHGLVNRACMCEACTRELIWKLQETVENMTRARDEARGVAARLAGWYGEKGVDRDGELALLWAKELIMEYQKSITRGKEKP